MGIMTMILPLAALAIALLIITALWLWWSGDRPDAPQLQTDAPGSEVTAVTTPQTASSAAVDTGSPESAPAPATSIALPPATIPQRQGSEILRVARGADGQLVVTFGGITYQTLSEMSDPTLRQQFMNTLRALAQFTQNVENGVTAPDAPAQTSAFPAAVPQAGFHSSAPVVLADSALSDAELAETPPDSMAGQIETLLQARLIRTPGMQHRAIHIYGAPGGGVQISVDGTYFETVGDVSDAEARTMIEAAIRDWEAANLL